MVLHLCLEDQAELPHEDLTVAIDRSIMRFLWFQKGKDFFNITWTILTLKNISFTKTPLQRSICCEVLVETMWFLFAAEPWLMPLFRGARPSSLKTTLPCRQTRRHNRSSLVWQNNYAQSVCLLLAFTVYTGYRWKWSVWFSLSAS